MTPEQKFYRSMEQTAVALGCHGILTYSFISPKYYDKIGLPADSPLRRTVTISNPLGEDTSIMRTTTLPSMLEVLATNYKNRNHAVSLYELGKEYLVTGPDTLPKEPNRFTLGMYGDGVDFYTIKGIVEALLKELHIENCAYKRCDTDSTFPETCALHPGRSAVIFCGETAIGYLGELHPTVQQTYGFGTKVYVAKLNAAELVAFANTEITYHPLPKFPATTRDLSLLCEDALPVAEMEAAIKQGVGSILEDVSIFDVYKGKQIEAGKKSVSFSIRMRSHEATLTDEQADRAMQRALKALNAIGAQLRES